MRRRAFVAGGASLAALTGLGTLGCVAVDAQDHPRAGRRAERAVRPDSRAPSRVAVTPLERVVRGAASASHTLVLMHGFGAAGDDLVPVGELLAERTPMRVVLPAAPIAMAEGGRAWWPLHDPHEARYVDRAVASVDALLDELVAGGTPPERIFVGGFSQGGILSIELALRHRLRLGGFVILSGRALEHPRTDDRALAGVPFFVSHGRHDPRIPLQRYEAFAARATAAGALLESHLFDGGHQIPSEVLSALLAWLRARTT